MVVQRTTKALSARQHSSKALRSVGSHKGAAWVMKMAPKREGGSGRQGVDASSPPEGGRAVQKWQKTRV
jgi:hypothetical protein